MDGPEIKRHILNGDVRSALRRKPVWDPPSQYNFKSDSEHCGAKPISGCNPCASLNSYCRGFFHLSVPTFPRCQSDSREPKCKATHVNLTG